MTPAVKTLAHVVLDFLAEHLHIKWRQHKAKKSLPPPSPAKKITRRRLKKRDYTPLTENQLIALARQFEKAKQVNADPNRKGPRITQRDIAYWANLKFGVNKDHRTYARYYKQWLNGDFDQ